MPSPSEIADALRGPSAKFLLFSRRLLAAALPVESVDVVPGAHDWLAWRKVWDHFLDRWPVLGWGA